MRNSCGHTVAKTQKFCPECGAPVVTPAETGPRVETFSAHKICLQVDCKVNILPTDGVATVVTITGDEEIKTDIQMAVDEGILTISQPESDSDVTVEDDNITVVRGRGNIVVSNITSVRGLTIISGGTSSSRPDIQITCPIGTQIDIDTDEIHGRIGDLQSAVTLSTSGDCTLKLGRIKELFGRAGGDLKINATTVEKTDLKSGGDAQFTADLVEAVHVNAGGDASVTISNGKTVAVEAGGDCRLNCQNISGRIFAEAGGDLAVNLDGGALKILILEASGDINCQITAQCQDAEIRAGGDIDGSLRATHHKVRAGGDNDLEIS